MTERKQLPLRLDPAVHDALARWAADELRSVNAQIELLLRDALRRAGRLPRNTTPIRPRGRPRRVESADSGDPAPPVKPAPPTSLEPPVGPEPSASAPTD